MTQHLTTSAPARGLTARYYPERIGDEALSDLAALAIGAVGEDAPTFTAWLLGWIDAEQERRIDAELADGGADVVPSEAYLPIVPVFDWSDAELGEALEASTILTFVVTDPEAGDFCDLLSRTIVAYASHRLQNRN